MTIVSISGGENNTRTEISKEVDGVVPIFPGGHDGHEGRCGDQSPKGTFPPLHYPDCVI